MDCPICYNLIENSCIESCCHHYCYKCLIRWCYNGGVSCPICKVPLFELKLDREFDSINNPTVCEIQLDFLKEISIDFGDNNIVKNNPGITLINNSGPGVKIKKLHKDAKCYEAGLRENNILLF